MNENNGFLTTHNYFMNNLNIKGNIFNDIEEKIEN